MIINVPQDQEPTRIDKFLHEYAPEHSRTFWQTQITENRVTINNTPITKHTKVTPGQIITFTPAEPIAKQKLELPHIDIIAETDNYIVIHKPDGIVVHPTQLGEQRASIAHWAIQHDQKIALVGDEPKLRPGIIHRLDRDVSGVMVIGKTQEFFTHLKTQFQNRTVHKEYTALVHGRELENEFEITFKLERKKGKGKMAAIPESREEGKSAHTHCKVLNRYTSSTLLSVHPTTGRMHQIRAHLYAYGFPIIGDTLYTSNKYTSKLDEKLGRIFLHASNITFQDLDDNTVSYEAPLPPKLTSFLESLKPLPPTS